MHCHESRLEIPCNPFNTHSHPLGSADTPILCEDNNCYPNSDSPCEDITSSCSGTRVRCSDGSCRVSSSVCPEQTCPLHLPVRCEDGKCVSDESECAPSCMANPVCRDGWVDCGNGLCAPSYGDCKLFLTRRNICEGDKPVMCADGTCASTLGMVSRRSVA